MSLIINAIISIPFFLISLFILWKKMRDDYINTQIFGLGFAIYLSLLVGVLLYHFTEIFYLKWIVVLAPGALTLYHSLNSKMRLNEQINALAPSLCIVNIYYYLILLGSDKNIFILIAIAVLLLLIIIYYLLEHNYKKFQWYKSGKTGFSGLIIISIYFMLNSLVAFTKPEMVFFSGNINAMISLLIGLTSAVALVRLSKSIS